MYSAPIVIRRDFVGLCVTDRAPPPPHSPADRVCLAELGYGWELRAFPPGGRFHTYFVRKGLLHVQLWHSEQGLSVLIPRYFSLLRNPV